MLLSLIFQYPVFILPSHCILFPFSVFYLFLLLLPLLLLPLLLNILFMNINGIDLPIDAWTVSCLQYPPFLRLVKCYVSVEVACFPFCGFVILVELHTSVCVASCDSPLVILNLLPWLVVGVDVFVYFFGMCFLEWGCGVVVVHLCGSKGFFFLLRFLLFRSWCVVVLSCGSLGCLCLASAQGIRLEWRNTRLKWRECVCWRRLWVNERARDREKKKER